MGHVSLLSISMGDHLFLEGFVLPDVMLAHPNHAAAFGQSGVFGGCLQVDSSQSPLSIRTFSGLSWTSNVDDFGPSSGLRSARCVLLALHEASSHT